MLSSILILTKINVRKIGGIKMATLVNSYLKLREKSNMTDVELIDSCRFRELRNKNVTTL